MKANEQNTLEALLHDVLIEVTAISSALVSKKLITNDELDTARITAEPIVDQKLRKIRRRTSPDKP
jgi:hypothetical protein